MEKSPNCPTIACLRCGYTLDGLPSTRCPECGQPFDPNVPETVRDLTDTRHSFPNRLFLAAVILGVLGNIVGRQPSLLGSDVAAIVDASRILCGLLAVTGSVLAISGRFRFGLAFYSAMSLAWTAVLIDVVNAVFHDELYGW